MDKTFPVSLYIFVPYIYLLMKHSLFEVGFMRNAFLLEAVTFGVVMSYTDDSTD